MQSVKVPVEKLLETLKVNRATHEKDFIEASEGFRVATIKELEKRLKEIKKGEKIDLYFNNLDEPESHLKDYDRVIQMLEMTEETHVTLSSMEFSQYVQDEWHWKESFLANSTTYKTFRGR